MTFQFNDEFFKESKDRDAAKERWPQIWFALDPGKIWDEMDIRDKESLKLKDKFFDTGRTAIVIAFVALVFTSLEIVILDKAATISPVVGGITILFAATLAFLLAIFGLTMALPNFKVGGLHVPAIGIGKKKSEWLRTRYVCERIRQWRWQYFMASLDEIAETSGDPEREQNYTAKRDAAFSGFLESMERESADVVRSIETGQEKLPGFGVVDQLQADLYKSGLGPAAEKSFPETLEHQLIDAYREVRIGGQLRYSNYQIDGTGLLKKHPGTQERTFDRWTHALLGWIVGFQVLTLVFTIGSISTTLIFEDWILLGYPTEYWKDPLDWVARGFQFFTLVAIFMSAAIATVREGFRSTVNVSRLRGYRDEVASIATDFDHSPGPAPATSMVSMERAAYNEMIDFLRAGKRSSFIL